MGWICMHCGTLNDLAASACIACEKRPPVVRLYAARISIRCRTLCQKQAYVVSNSILCIYTNIRRVFSEENWLRYTMHAVSTLSLVVALVCVGVYWRTNMPALSELHWQVSAPAFLTMDKERIVALSPDKLVRQLESTVRKLAIHTAAIETGYTARVDAFASQWEEKSKAASQSVDRFMNRSQRFTMVDVEPLLKKDGR